MLPAWMTEGIGAGNLPERADDPSDRPRRDDQFQNASESRDEVDDKRRRDRSRSRSRSPSDRERNGDRDGEGRPLYRPSRRATRKSNFDVMPDGTRTVPHAVPPQPTQPPPPSLPMPPAAAGSLGMSFSLPTQPAAGAVSAFGSYNPAAAVAATLGGAVHAGGATPDMQSTRHARRLYVGGIPPGTTDNDILAFFTSVVTKCAPEAYRRISPVVLAVYLNTEKWFSFVEFATVELTTACLALDGVTYTGARSAVGIAAGTGSHGVLRLRRPNDYKPDLVPPASRSCQPLDLSAIGVIATSVPDGPNKIFFGGLPTSLGEEQIKELLSTFGPLKGFHLVRDPGNPLSKGYGFFEYVDSSVTPIAITGLNGLQVMDKTISVKSSNAAIAAGAAPTPTPNLAAFTGGGAVPQQAVTAPPAVPPAMEIGMKQPTKVLHLKNMVSAAELQDDGEHADIIDDVRTECAQYGGPGAVTSVLIPRAKEGYPVAAEGSVFVSFSDSSVARTAAMALSGRKFGNNIVSVDYYDENNFARGVLV